MEKFLSLSEEEIKLGFVSSCIEFVAEELKTPYIDVFRRMQRAKMLDEYIYKCYNALHSESRENVTAELIESCCAERRRQGDEINHKHLHYERTVIA